MFSINLRYYPFLASAVCLTLSGVYHSVGMAAVAATMLLIIAVRDSISQYIDSKKAQERPGLPDEFQRKIQDLNARVATLEYGVKQRGF